MQDKKGQGPRGLHYLIANEVAERFSFYGMKAVLVVFMTTALLNTQGQPLPMTETQAKTWFHVFLSAVYMAPIAGAILSDLLIGKYMTILSLSIVYCIGHAALAADHTRTGLAIGLTLIAIGSGGIKPCVSANIGDQIEAAKLPASRIFAWFYLAINLGAFLSMIITPAALHAYGPSAAFAIPGILMLMATALFYAGRNKFTKKPPQPRRLLKDIASAQTRRQLATLAVTYALVAVFWSLYDQIGSSLLLQATKMAGIAGIPILPAQMQAANPLLILIFIPAITYIAYPAMSKKKPLTDSAKITTGMALAAAAFAIAIAIQHSIDIGMAPNILWQLPVYALLTAAEVMVSITCLEMSYKRAPETMKSIVMALFMLSISAGNLITAATNMIAPLVLPARYIGADTAYFAFFTTIMLAATLAFASLSRQHEAE